MAIRVDSELWWYFNDAAGELGMRSSFGPMVDHILGGGGGNGSQGESPLLPVESDRALAAVKRWRQVHAVLSVLPQVQCDVLQAFHLQKDRGTLDLVYPGNLAGVVLLLAGKEPRKADQEAWRGKAGDATAEAMAGFRDASMQFRNVKVDAKLERLERMRSAA